MESGLLFLILLLYPAFTSCGHISKLVIQDPDYGAPTPVLITSRGFGYERHYVLSEDGFLNAIHRIINPKFRTTRSAILMFHGTTGASSNFLNNDLGGHINEPPEMIGSNIGFELAKRGHDVWLADQRGTPFSSNNTFYHPKQKEYWDWSVDEIALLDLPAIIDYITAYTRRKRIAFIGHSQGSHVMFMLLSRMLHYNDIIRPYIALTPTFYLGNTVISEAPILSDLPIGALAPVLAKIGGPLANSLVTDIIREACRPLITQELVCKPLGYLFLTFGSLLYIPTPPAIQWRRLPVYLSSSLYYTVSSRQLAHLIQMTQSNAPRMMDYSPAVNKKMYGTSVPPAYDARLISCKTMAFISAVSDTLASPKDVQQLRNALTVKLIYDKVITDPTFGHGSFVFGDREKVIAYVIKPVLAILDSFY